MALLETGELRAVAATGAVRLAAEGEPAVAGDEVSLAVVGPAGDGGPAPERLARRDLLLLQLQLGRRRRPRR